MGLDGANQIEMLQQIKPPRQQGKVELAVGVTLPSFRAMRSIEPEISRFPDAQLRI
jgi:hypothetical protein